MTRRDPHNPCDIENLAFERGHRTLRIVGKGNKPAVIPFVPRTARTIDLAVGERHEGPILLRRDGVRLDRRTAHRWVCDRSASERDSAMSIPTCCAPLSSWPRSPPVCRYVTFNSPHATPTPAPPRSTTADVTTHLAGGSDAAGFVQAMKVSGVDRQRVTAADHEFESIAPQVRPDLIGGIRVWTGPDGFVEANYFTSEHDARDGESKDPPPELAEALEDFMAMMKDAEYFDFTEPFVHSAPSR